MRMGLLVVVALGGTASADPTPPPIKIGIVPGVAVNLDASRVDALAQDLADALSAELVVEAVGGLEVRRQLPSDLAPDCVTTPACVADVAKRLGASQLLFVVMVDTGAGGSIQIDSTWVDVATNQTASRPPVDLTTIANARQRFVGAAHQLLPDAPLRPKPKHDTISGGHARHFTAPAFATAGVGLVGLGVGIGFGLSGRSKYNSCNADGTRCEQDRRDSIRRTTLTADAGWLVALAGAVATGILYSSSAEAPHVIVAPTPNGMTVGATGRF